MATPPNLFLGNLFALAAALVWGSADFGGGFATRRRNPLHVLALSASAGLLFLVIIALINREPFPGWVDLGWAALAGISGAVGLTCLYQGLAIGVSAVVAPTSGVIGAALPVAFGLLTQGLPDLSHLIGFGLAFAGIWVVSASTEHKTAEHRKGFLLACISGIGVAGFMICMSQVDPGKVYTPLVVSRSMVVIGAMLILALNRSRLPGLGGNWICVLIGVVDALGNIFFMLAKSLTRLDNAVVLSSLNPAATVLLTGIVLKEKLSLKQWIGVIVCLTAIVLIVR